MKRKALFMLLILCASKISYGQYMVWRESTFEDFSVGLRSNIEIITPDPDGTDNGALQLVATDTIRILQIYPDLFDTLLVAQALQTYAPAGVPPLNLRTFVVPLSIFNTISSESSFVTARDPLTLETIRVPLYYFDVLFFGIADSYGSSSGSTDLSASAANAVRGFARMGKGVIFSHDTIWAIASASHPNFNSLSDISGLSASPRAWTVFNYVKRVSTHISDPVLNVPFILPDHFDVTSCHETGQYVVDGETWYVGTDASGSANYGIYWHTYHNPTYDSYGAYFSYGHVSLPPHEWEAKAMINSIYYSYHGGRGIGVFTSRVFDAGEPTALVRIGWSADIPPGSTMTVEIRSAYAPGMWTEWMPVSAGELTPPQSGRLFQYRVQMTKNPASGGRPTLHWIKLEFLSPSVTAEIISPVEGAISSCPSQGFEIVIHTPRYSDTGEPLCPIDSNSIVVNVNGSTYRITDPQIHMLNDSILTFTPSSNWRTGDTISFCLDSLSNTCGGALEEPLCSYFVSDITPPAISNETPENETWVADFSPDISVDIQDAPAGIDTSSIELIINDSLRFTPGSPGVHFDGTTFMLSTEEAGITFAEGERVNVRLGPIRDNAGICGPNSSPEYSWSFAVQVVDVWFRDTIAAVGDTLLIPVYSDELGGLDVRSISVKIPLDPSYLTYVSVVKTGTALDGWGTTTISYINDTLTVKGTGTSAIRSNPVLFFIRALVALTAVPGGYTNLNFSEVTMNDGALGTHYRGALLVIRQRPISWMVDLILSQRGAINQTRLTFGGAETGSDMFDPGLDRIYLPPTPGTPTGYFLLNDPRYPYIRALQRDIRSKDADSLTWIVKTVGETGMLEWDKSSLPQGRFVIGSVYDMKAVDRYEFGRNEEVTISYSLNESEPATITLKRGWNLISFQALPVIDLTEVLGSSNIFWYNPALRSYERATIAEPGKGYWVLATSDTVIRYAGVPVRGYTIQVFRGWNLIGGIASERPVDFRSPVTTPSGIILPPAYRFNPTTHSYEASSELTSGTGYWILSTESGTLTVTGTR